MSGRSSLHLRVRAAHTKNECKKETSSSVGNSAGSGSRSHSLRQGSGHGQYRRVEWKYQGGKEPLPGVRGTLRKEKIPTIFEKRRDLLLHHGLKNV
ncbi:MAG: hypothetical protein JWO71_533 [Candidatus Acidoferrum typicum]|nr:hypothetical protein [Candidatus Acidoferrum typicum]